MDLTMRTGGAAAAGETAAPFAGARGAWLVVLLLTAVGAYLRLANLGELGFRWDEDLTSLAVRAILENGTPELPSGMVYLRGGWLLYLMAGSAELLGFSELSLRLPAALFGIALIPLTFVFARALFGTATGVVAAALMSISVWDVEISRYARMYAPFAFFYLLTAFLTWRYRIERQSAVGGAAAVGAALVSISLHQLGYTLALVFLLLPLVSGQPLARDRRQLVWPIGAAAVTAAFFLFWNGFLEHFRNVPLRGAPEAAAAEPVAGIAQRAVTTLLDGLASAAPDLPFAVALAERAPLLLVVFGIVAALSVGWYVRGRLEADDRRPVDLADTLLLSAVAVAAVLQIFNVALLAAAWLAYRKRCGLGAVRSGSAFSPGSRPPSRSISRRAVYARRSRG